MENEIKNWINELCSVTDSKVMIEQVEKFDLSALINSNENIQELLNIIDVQYSRIDKKMFPYFLEALYAANNVDKFYLFCYLLDKTCDELEFLPNLENYPMFKEKFRVLLPTLIKVADRCYNGIGNCMYLILLKAANNKELFDKDSINNIIKIVSNKMNLILEYLDKNDLDEITSFSLEILVDVAKYFNDTELLDLVHETLKLQNNTIKMFAVLTLLCNNKPVDAKMLTDLSSDLETASRFYDQLELVKKTEFFDKTYASQEYIAKSNLVNWLKYPTELGKPPNKIEFVDTIEKENIVYYIFKFTTDIEKFKNDEWLLGISGGYEKDTILTSSTTGFTFSMFEKMETDYITQATKILNLIEEHWKQRT